MDTLIQSDITKARLDKMYRSSGLGGLGALTYSLLNGLNIRGRIPNLPPSVDDQGVTFFTKPCLNLSYHNVINLRRMAFLADTDRYSMGNAIRCMLNPVGLDNTAVNRFGTNIKEPAGDEYRSFLIDDKNAFIPMLSGTLLSLSGWPDFSPDTYTSPEGIAKEQVSWIDSRGDQNGIFDLTATFLNMEGDPVSKLFSVWLEYSTRVAEGSMMPFYINMVENRIDYQTRIYRFTLDRSGRYIQSVTACAAAFPISDPRGAKVNYTTEKSLTEENNKIIIPFRANIPMYDDPILLDEFNKTVILSNGDMHDAKRESIYTKLNTSNSGVDETNLFSYKSYPRVNVQTNELEWWTPTVIYKSLMETL